MYVFWTRRVLDLPVFLEFAFLDPKMPGASVLPVQPQTLLVEQAIDGRAFLLERFDDQFEVGVGGANEELPHARMKQFHGLDADADVGLVFSWIDLDEGS